LLDFLIRQKIHLMMQKSAKGKFSQD